MNIGSTGEIVRCNVVFSIFQVLKMLFNFYTLYFCISFIVAALNNKGSMSLHMSFHLFSSMLWIAAKIANFLPQYQVGKLEVGERSENVDRYSDVTGETVSQGKIKKTEVTMSWLSAKDQTGLDFLFLS